MPMRLTATATRYLGRALLAASWTALGAASALAWAPWSLSWLLALAFGALCLTLVRTASPVPASLLALLFSLGQQMVGHGWVFHALAEHTGLSIPLAVLGSSGFMLYLASFQAIPVYLWARFLRRRFAPHALAQPALLAALLALGEWLRSTLFNGTSSLAMGYALLDTPLAGLLPIIGLYGLGFVGLFFCLGWPLAARALLRRSHRPALTLLVLFAIVLSGAHVGAGMPWIEPAGTPLDFRLLQTVTPQQEKFVPERIPREITQLAERLMARPASLIVAPETAFPTFFHQLPSGLIERLSRFARDSGSHLFIGIARMGHPQRGHNTVMHLSAGQAPPDFFAKERLMPFGEYSPAGFDWFSQRLHLAFQDLSPAPPGQRPFVAAGRTLAPLICHEDSSSQLARRRAAAASILLNPSNLAWFAGSAALPQGLAMARARALETGRPVLRATNSGGADHIDHHGRLAASLPAGLAGELSGQVQPTRGATPYVRYGDLPVLIFCLALPLIAMSRRQAARHLWSRR